MCMKLRRKAHLVSASLWYSAGLSLAKPMARIGINVCREVFYTLKSRIFALIKDSWNGNKTIKVFFKGGGNIKFLLGKQGAVCNAKHTVAADKSIGEGAWAEAFPTQQSRSDTDGGGTDAVAFGA